ncbi:hypothetical protein GV794_02125 [Nocardia cyriacigeorgica]|uniref:ESX-1 secretion-associated protein n=1 Tax=Nocardia cyriacigeorgica TaxID=135487 RepID=A0ABX0CL50_9NOCA|nr:hypothetical protein [Nocardia cyriacigeorgica]NEW42758.1 hypothetical protein [Nocardia cyriacigeorgica]NEW53947.1 hypothetical protein [Nocardia cyriacigeorgica]NEW54464.1 hypothetical protein [Nocardia cyriacigeorgica]
MTDYNPVTVEAAIRQCANQIAEGVQICGTRYAEYLDADREYDVACARAYLAAAGPVHTRQHTVELATQDERARRDAADAAYRYADRRARALEAELRALQSVGASIRQMYGVAGRGEGM